MADIMQKARDRVGSKRVKQSKPVIIDALTDAATSLMTEDADAFELTREEIAHALQISQVTVPQARPAGEITPFLLTPLPDLFVFHDF